MRRIRVLFLIAIALWLPLQTAASWAMPLCAHVEKKLAAQPDQQEMAGMAAHCHEHANTAPTKGTDGDFDCDNCGICHLASTGFLITSADAGVSPAVGSVLVPRLQLAAASFIPDPLQDPPRRTN